MIQRKKKPQQKSQPKQSIEQSTVDLKQYTQKELMFCYSYVNNNCIEKSAKLAGFAPRSAATQGNRMLKKERIRDLVEYLTQQKLNTLGISSAKVLEEVALIAFSDMGKICSWENGQPFEIRSTEELGQLSRCIKEIQMFERNYKKKNLVIRSIKLKLYDKLSALQLLGQNLQLFTEKLKLEGLECLVVE